MVNFPFDLIRTHEYISLLRLLQGSSLIHLENLILILLLILWDSINQITLINWLLLVWLLSTKNISLWLHHLLSLIIINFKLSLLIIRMEKIIITEDNSRIISMNERDFTIHRISNVVIGMYYIIIMVINIIDRDIIINRVENLTSTNELFNLLTFPRFDWNQQIMNCMNLFQDELH